MITKESILAFFKERTQPLAFREIAHRLGLSRPEARALKRLLRQLMADGSIVHTRKGLYGPSEDMSLLSGSYEAHRDGFGFVITDRPRERDIFIPRGAGLGAMNGDRVVARVENRQRRSGRIVRILERSSRRIIGRLDLTKTAAYVRPKNKTIPFDLYISPADRGGAKQGDIVLVEILDYPTEKRPPAARVIKIIGDPESPSTQIEIIMDEYSLPRRFPKAAADEAKLLRSVEAGTGLSRKDLRHLNTVTIDGEKAKDFDDAVSVSLTGAGYKLLVHIADVGFYVAWDSALDLEARKRGTSVYFPDRVIPMLPRRLSEDLCSLRPRTDRLAFTVELDFDRAGVRTKASFYPSLIRSNERMTYSSVKRILIDNDPQEQARYEYLLQDFHMMADLCGLLRSRRMERGSLDFDLPEPEVIIDLQGNPEAIVKAERNFAHLIIEEFMIAANEAVAEHLQSLGVPSLYRIHEEPDVMKMEDVMRVIRPLRKLGKKDLTPADFPSLLKSIKNTPEEEVINYVMLRSLKQARYSPVNVGHFGLASSCYTHFTSPIRRYPDLVVHRILREVLTKKLMSDRRRKELESSLADIAFSSSQKERQADEAERDVIDAMRVWFMKDRIGEEFEASIVGITPYGLRVRLREYYVDGIVHLSSLTDDFYLFDDRTLRLTGRHSGRTFRIGDRIRIRVDRVDMLDREILFGL